MTTQTTHRLRHWIAAGKLALFVLLCWCLYRALTGGNAALSEHPWRVEPGWLVISGVCYLLSLLPAAIFWQHVLVATGQPAGLGEAVRAYYISLLGKYVPGKWMVIVLRRALLRSPRIESTIVAASVFYETFTLLAVAAAVSAISLVIWQSDNYLLIGAAVGSFFLMGVPIVPSVFEWLLGVLGVGKLNATAGARFRGLGWRTILIGWVAIGCGWLLAGVSFWATLRGLDALDTGPLTALSLHTATNALSVVAGFLSQIPGGLVVREWVSLQLVEPRYGAAVAAVSVIIYRLVSLISELIIAAVLYIAGWRPSRLQTEKIESELVSAES